MMPVLLFEVVIPKSMLPAGNVALVQWETVIFDEAMQEIF